MSESQSENGVRRSRSISRRSQLKKSSMFNNSLTSQDTVSGKAIRVFAMRASGQARVDDLSPGGIQLKCVLKRCMYYCNCNYTFYMTVTYFVIWSLLDAEARKLSISQKPGGSLFIEYPILFFNIGVFCSACGSYMQEGSTYAFMLQFWAMVNSVFFSVYVYLGPLTSMQVFILCMGASSCCFMGWCQLMCPLTAVDLNNATKHLAPNEKISKLSIFFAMFALNQEEWSQQTFFERQMSVMWSMRMDFIMTVVIVYSSYTADVLVQAEFMGLGLQPEVAKWVWYLNGMCLFCDFPAFAIKFLQPEAIQTIDQKLFVFLVTLVTESIEATLNYMFTEDLSLRLFSAFTSFGVIIKVSYVYYEARFLHKEPKPEEEAIEEKS